MENLDWKQKKEIKTNINTNTDPKPHICYFNGDFETCVNIFFQKIKPLEGIIKYKMVAWDKFPVSIEEAKTISSEWVKKFQSSNKYSDLRISIYFHLTSKTIRFELKQKNSIIKLEQNENVENIILSATYILGKTIIFDCANTKYFDDFDLAMCKQKGKELAFGLESQYLNNKFIVFLNPASNTIQITMN